MTMPLLIVGWGAVTPVGLVGITTCAAIRAGICRFKELSITGDPLETIVGAQVPASWRLRLTDADWLLNLAVKAIEECLADEQPATARTAVFLCPPEPTRAHPGMAALAPAELLDALMRRLGVRISAHSAVLTGGPASTVAGLRRARALLEHDEITHAVVGGMDSLVNPRDVRRLQAEHRLAEEGNPQGLVPSEGAAFLLVSTARQRRRFRPLGFVLGTGMGQEPNTVRGDDFSIGEGIRSALREAVAEAGVAEAELGFVCSTFNGERYSAWESAIARAAFYRSRREALPVLYPAMAVGDMGTASGGLALLYGSMAIARDYAPGRLGMCEVSSDGGLRGACVIGPGQHAAFETPRDRAREA